MKILLIGCGKMGGALLTQWVGDTRTAFTVVDPGVDSVPAGATLVRDRAGLHGPFDAIVIAVKPQAIDDVVPDYVDLLAGDGCLVSIAAGYAIARLKRLAGDRPVVRAMPNLPSAIGQGVSGLCASADANDAQRAMAQALMMRAGAVVWVDDEDAIDRVTAIAGSGPGYVFEIARAFVEAAMAMGFDADQARDLVLGTMAGTIAMAQGSTEPLEDLRNAVTSKHGTTAAGLAVLNGDGALTRRLRETAEAAYARAVELR